MKAVLISIRPKWCEKIASGEKKIEVRKSRPKLQTPFKCYIYCTLPRYPHEDFIKAGAMWRRQTMTKHKRCYGKCDRCVWKNNGGCSEWRSKKL